MHIHALPSTLMMALCVQVTPGRLAQLNRCMRGIRVGNFEPVQEQLHLGDALGNRFEITLRYPIRLFLQPCCVTLTNTLNTPYYRCLSCSGQYSSVLCL